MIASKLLYPHLIASEYLFFSSKHLHSYPIASKHLDSHLIESKHLYSHMVISKHLHSHPKNLHSYPVASKHLHSHLIASKHLYSHSITSKHLSYPKIKLLTPYTVNQPTLENGCYNSPPHKEDFILEIITY